jgi:hypothetical protein
MQPGVRLTGLGAPVLGRRGVLAVLFPPAGRCTGQCCPRGVAVRQVVEGIGRVGGDVDGVSDVKSSIVGIAW